MILILNPVVNSDQGDLNTRKNRRENCVTRASWKVKLSTAALVDNTRLQFTRFVEASTPYAFPAMAATFKEKTPSEILDGAMIGALLLCRRAIRFRLRPSTVLT